MLTTCEGRSSSARSNDVVDTCEKRVSPHSVPSPGRSVAAGASCGRASARGAALGSGVGEAAADTSAPWLYPCAAVALLPAGGALLGALPPIAYWLPPQAASPDMAKINPSADQAFFITDPRISILVSIVASCRKQRSGRRDLTGELWLGASISGVAQLLGLFRTFAASAVHPVARGAHLLLGRPTRLSFVGRARELADLLGSALHRVERAASVGAIALAGRDVELSACFRKLHVGAAVSRARIGRRGTRRWLGRRRGRCRRWARRLGSTRIGGCVRRWRRRVRWRTRRFAGRLRPQHRLLLRSG